MQIKIFEKINNFFDKFFHPVLDKIEKPKQENNIFSQFNIGEYTFLVNDYYYTLLINNNTNLKKLLDIEIQTLLTNTDFKNKLDLILHDSTNKNLIPYSYEGEIHIYNLDKEKNIQSVYSLYNNIIDSIEKNNTSLQIDMNEILNKNNEKEYNKFKSGMSKSGLSFVSGDLISGVINAVKSIYELIKDESQKPKLTYEDEKIIINNYPLVKGLHFIIAYNTLKLGYTDFYNRILSYFNPDLKILTEYIPDVNDYPYR